MSGRKPQQEVQEVKQEVMQESAALETMLSLVESDGITDGSTYTETIRLVNPIKDIEEIDLHDVTLCESIRKIRAGLVAQSLSTRIVARELANLNLDAVHTAGFTDIKQFAKAVFDIKPNTTSQYLRIGAKFITDDYRVVDGLPQSWTVGHFIEVNSLVQDEDKDGEYDYTALKAFIAESGVTALTSVQKLRKAVQSYRLGTDGQSTKAIELKDNQNIDENSKENENSKDSNSHKEYSGSPVSQVVDMSTKEIAGSILDHVSAIKQLWEKLNKGGIEIIFPENEVEKIEALVLTYMAE